MAERTERKSSALESPSNHRFSVLHTNKSKTGLEHNNLSAEIGKPHMPGEAEAFILDKADNIS